MMEAATVEAPYLLTSKMAQKRYSIGQRTLDDLYRRDPEFPALRVGKKVLIHREQADAYFTRYIREVIETE
jgi:hypothetical protein